jgi:hypothetical protein
MATHLEVRLDCLRPSLSTDRREIVEVKSSTGPTGGTVSRTARVSIARWNLKEAAGKALARRSGIAYEAVLLDEEAIISKVRYLYGEHGRRWGGHKREGGFALPGEICSSATGYRH